MIGFALEKVQGRRATLQDFAVVSKALSRLHEMGIRHGDMNRNNFIITDQGAVLLDFAEARGDSDAHDEMTELKDCLQSSDTTGYYPNAWENLRGKND